MSMDVNGYTTHQPVLVACAMQAEGPVVETGAGHYSTALLHTICQLRGVPLISFDEDPAWAAAMNRAYTGRHVVRHSEDIAADVAALAETPDMMFVDNGAYKIAALWQRRRVLEVARDRGVRLVVCHDTEPKNRYKYQFDKAFKWFTYRVDFRGLCYRLDPKFPERPWATALSNTDDLKWLREALPEKTANG